MSGPILSAVVICKNEEKNISQCLSSLSFCDEIILVDSGSTDATCQIAEKLGAKIFHREWTGYSDQKNFGNDQARGKWILSLDADEEVSESLKNEIIIAIQNSPFHAYKIPRKTFHTGQWIQFGGWYPNHLIRLFQKSSGFWEGDEVHEVFCPQGPVGILESPLIHHSFNCFQEQAEKNNKYSTLGAQRLQRKGVRFSLLLLVTKPPLKFLETFILKRGFLDGMRGFIIAVMAGHSVFLKWAKLWELESVEKKEKD